MTTPRPSKATAAPSCTRVASTPPSQPTASRASSSPEAPRRSCLPRCPIPPPLLPLSLLQQPMGARSLAALPGLAVPHPERVVVDPLRHREAA